jgi:hypothetical protein
MKQIDLLSSQWTRKQITLLEARQQMLTQMRNGLETVCPCCTRKAAIYKRKIHAEMVLWLIGLDRLCSMDENYHTTVEILSLSKHLKAGGTDGTFLVHWGLIERNPEPNKAGAPAASYRITQKGKDFLHNGARVPARAIFVFGNVEGFDEEVTTAREAVRDKFDYDQMINDNEHCSTRKEIPLVALGMDLCRTK